MSETDAPRTQRIPPTVPAGGRFVGLLAFRGPAVLVEGEVIGPIVGAGSLELAGTGVVVGDVQVDELLCAGRIDGDVTVRQLARIEEGATLRGTLGAPRAAVANGALIQGRCSVGARGE